MVERGLAATGFEEVGPALAVQRRPHRDRRRSTKGLADRYEGTQTALSLPRTRVDAFNIDLANELTRNGRRCGLTFAPEGGSERIRKVINKMVTEEDLIRTVDHGVPAGWRQVKLYFMCGLPTETDDDVLQIAELAKQVIETGREVSGTRDIRCTVSIGGFVPKPHTPFQWAAQLDHETTDARLAKLRDAIRSDSAVRQGHRLPLPRRQAGHRRGTAVPRRPPRRPGHRGGLARRRPLRRLERALLLRALDALRRRGARRRARSTSTGTPPASASTPRCCPGTTSTPGSTRTGSGRTGRTPSPRSRSRTAAGRRASTAASAPRWAPRSRSARPARRCSR